MGRSRFIVEVLPITVELPREKMGPRTHRCDRTTPLVLWVCCHTSRGVQGRGPPGFGSPASGPPQKVAAQLPQRLTLLRPVSPAGIRCICTGFNPRRKPLGESRNDQDRRPVMFRTEHTIPVTDT